MQSSLCGPWAPPVWVWVHTAQNVWVWVGLQAHDLSVDAGAILITVVGVGREWADRKKPSPQQLAITHKSCMYHNLVYPLSGTALAKPTSTSTVPVALPPLLFLGFDGYKTILLAQ